MPTYMVINKPLIRTTLVPSTTLDANKLPFTVLVKGADIVIKVGETLTDVNDAELIAFSDRLEKKSDEPTDVPPWNGMPGIGHPEGGPPQEEGPAVRRLNPDLFALVLRVQRGEGTADENTVAPDILEFMAKHNAETATPDDVTLMEDVLRDFGMPLFA